MRRRPSLRLEALDERAVPDATSPTQPADPPPAVPGDPTPGISIPTMSAGQYMPLGDIEGFPAFFFRANDGNHWLVLTDGAESGQFQATFLGGSANGLADVLPTTAAQADYQSDAAKWTMAYDPAVGTWTVYQPGATFAGAVAGYSTADWNVVLPAEYATANVAAPPMVPVIPNLPPMPQPGPVMPQGPITPVPQPPGPAAPGTRPVMPPGPVVIPPGPGGMPTAPQGPVPLPGQPAPPPGGQPPAPGGQPAPPGGGTFPGIPIPTPPLPPKSNPNGDPPRPITTRIIIEYVWVWNEQDQCWEINGYIVKFDPPVRPVPGGASPSPTPTIPPQNIPIPTLPPKQ